MKLETFFEKFDQFADAPDAVAKIRYNAGWAAPSGLRLIVDAIPRALPWAGVGRAVGAPNPRPNGAPQGSLGQRPRKTVPRSFQALKGRYYSCEQHRAAPSGLEIL